MKFNILSVFMSLIFVFGCGKKKEEATTTSSTSASVENMKKVSSSLIPSSLATSTTSLELQGLCGSLDIFACQPILLKQYMGVSKTIFDATVTIVGAVNNLVSLVADGGKGSQVDEATGVTYSWSKTSGTEYTLLSLSKTGKPVIWLNVTNLKYEMKIDFDAAGSADVSGQGHFTVNYVDETHWDVDVLWVGIKCNAADPGPTILDLKNKKDGSLWTGKAMLYSPNFGKKTPSCANSTSTTAGFVLYTDYVASASVARGSVYSIAPTVTDLSSIANYDLSKACKNYSSTLEGCSGYAEELTSYKNSFCAKKDVTSPTFNSDCSTESSDLKGVSYGAATDWIAPATFVAKTVTLPTSL